MELTAVAAALLRRWYVVLVGMALTAGLVYYAHGAVPPTYSASASILLLPPGASLPDGSNPLLALGGLEQPAALVVAYLAGDDARQAFAAQFPKATYDIVLDPLSRGPLVLITVKDPAPGDAMSALNAILTQFPDALTKLQDEVAAPAKSRVTSMPLSVDTLPTTVRSATLRALIAAAGVGMVLTLVGAVAVDSLALRRRERLASRVVDDEPEPAPVAPRASFTAAPESPVELELGLDERLDEPPSTQWPPDDDPDLLRDFPPSESRSRAEWPARTHDEPPLDDESRVAPRA